MEICSLLLAWFGTWLSAFKCVLRYVACVVPHLGIGFGNVVSLWAADSHYTERASPDLQHQNQAKVGKNLYYSAFEQVVDSEYYYP